MNSNLVLHDFCLRILVVASFFSGVCPLGTLVLNGGQFHSTNSTILCTASIPVVRANTYRLRWRFNKINVCVITVKNNEVMAGTATCPQSSTSGAGFYYAANSKISGVILDDVLILELSYSRILHEKKDIIMDIYDLNSAKTSNNEILSVRNCTENSGGLVDAMFETAVSCAYNCKQYAQCIDSYAYSEVVCLANSLWAQVEDCDANVEYISDFVFWILVFGVVVIANLLNHFLYWLCIKSSAHENVEDKRKEHKDEVNAEEGRSLVVGGVEGKDRSATPEPALMQNGDENVEKERKTAGTGLGERCKHN